MGIEGGMILRASTPDVSLAGPPGKPDWHGRQDDVRIQSTAVFPRRSRTGSLVVRMRSVLKLPLLLVLFGALSWCGARDLGAQSVPAKPKQDARLLIEDFNR